MNAANLLRGLVVFSLLTLGESLAGGEGSIGGVTRVPPTRDVQQVELRLYAVEMSGQTLRQLGLWTAANNDRLGSPAAESPLLKNAETWEAALETAVRLGAVRVISAPTIATVSGRAAEMECLGVDFDQRAAKKAGPANRSVKWSVKPTVTGSDKVQIDFRFRLSVTHPLEVASPARVRPSDSGLEAHTSVEIPLLKPTVLAGLVVSDGASVPKAEKGATSAKGPDEAAQGTATLLVVTANRIDAKHPAQAKGERK
jgi:hypothetical protein